MQRTASGNRSRSVFPLDHAPSSRCRGIGDPWEVGELTGARRSEPRELVALDLKEVDRPNVDEMTILFTERL